MSRQPRCRCPHEARPRLDSRPVLQTLEPLHANPRIEGHSAAQRPFILRIKAECRPCDPPGFTPPCLTHRGTRRQQAEAHQMLRADVSRTVDLATPRTPPFLAGAKERCLIATCPEAP